MVSGLTTDERRDLVMSVGTHQRTRRLSPFEVGLFFKRAIDAGASLPECAQLAQFKGTTMVSRFLKLLKLSPALQHTVDWGQTGAAISFATATLLAGLEQTDQEHVAAQVMAHDMRKPEVQQIVQLHNRSGRTIEECVQEVLQMRPVVVQRHLFLGAITEESVKEHLKEMKQGDRDHLLEKILADQYPSAPKMSARCGLDRFTIVTSEDGGRHLREASATDFETAINLAMVKKIAIL